MPEPQLLTVTDLTRSIKTTLESTFAPFWLTGEVGNLTMHRSGHVYLTIKDANAQIQAVYFSGAGVARQIGLAQGMAVEIYGRLTVYEPRGNYQLIVRELRPRGLGALRAEFERLKQQLHAEGLFAAERKRPLPLLPRCIGVVTSPNGAALQDFLKIIQRRFAAMPVRIFPAAVQGPGAAPQIIAGLDYFNRTRSCDVVVLTRGGGSIEDLWCFNDELVARAIARSQLPVISAVGHEVDVTISDYVADHRAPTPSAAAELVVATQRELLERVARQRRAVANALKMRLGDWRTRVARAANHYVFRQPGNLVRRHQQRVDELHARLVRTLKAQLEDGRSQLRQAQLRLRSADPRSAALAIHRQRVQAVSERLGRALRRRGERRHDELTGLRARLRLLDPHQVLSRGYAILLEGGSGRAVRAADQVSPGDLLLGRVADGELRLRVEGAQADDGRGSN